LSYKGNPEGGIPLTFLDDRRYPRLWLQLGYKIQPSREASAIGRSTRRTSST